jgi:hypothetical protein
VVHACMESFSVFRAAGGSLARARARLIPFLHSTGRRSTIDDASTRQVYHPVQFTLIPRVIGRSGRYVRRVGTTLASSAHGPLELYTTPAVVTCRTDQYSYYCTVQSPCTRRRAVHTPQSPPIFELGHHHRWASVIAAGRGECREFGSCMRRQRSAALSDHVMCATPVSIYSMQLAIGAGWWLVHPRRWDSPIQIRVSSPAGEGRAGARATRQRA